jgi:diguanylate cyclase (GGDEF)-like protein
VIGLIGVCLPAAAGAEALRPGGSLCHAVSESRRADAMPPRRFACRGVPSGYQKGSLWLRADLTRVPVDRGDLVLMVHQTRFDRLAVAFSYADGVVVRQQVRSGDFGTQWRAGGQIAFEAPLRDAPLVSLTMRFDHLASQSLLRLRLLTRGDGARQSAILSALIGAALTLLLIGALYNLSLAIAVRRRFLAWHGAWAACVLVWGTIWSQLDLLVVPGFAGTASSQTCTFLACLAITLATVSAITSLGTAARSRWLTRATLAIGIAVGLFGIPAALIRSAALDTVGTVLAILVLADLAAVVACLVRAWRHGSAEARDLIAAWAIPMAALALTQMTDIGGALWGGGAQVLVLFAAAWQTIWLSIAATRRLARLRIERDRAQAAEALASELAARDPLTGLNNRRGFIRRVTQLIDQARAEHAPVALLLIDIDRFKAVNDMHGHEAGDTVLCTIAARLRRWESESCAVARFGGEELALVIVGIDGFALAQFAEGVRIEIAACDHSAAIGGHVVTASIGVAETRRSEGFQHLYRAADRALYAAKRAGRNRVVLHREAPPAPRPGGETDAIRARG